MNLLLPDFYTEAHKIHPRQEELATALAAEGVQCKLFSLSECDMVLCGSFFTYKTYKNLYARAREQGISVVHYCWDLYPFQLEGPIASDYERVHRVWWQEYLEELKRSEHILVPSYACAKRVAQYAGREATVVQAPVKPWDDVEPFDGGYVVDVMRKYDDPKCGAVKAACNRLGIPCIEPGCKLPWDEFRRVIAGARLLVSAYDEASTGGLTLLEGHYLGKPILLSDSRYNGAKGYFGGKAAYFRHDDPTSLDDSIRVLFHNPPKHDRQECRRWIRENYTDCQFARSLASYFRTLLGSSKSNTSS